MSASRPPSPTLALLLVGAVAIGCASEGDHAEELELLRAELSDAEAAEAERDERIDDLEATIGRLEGSVTRLRTLERAVADLEETSERLTARDPMERLDETDAELERLTERLASLDETLEAAVTDGEAVDRRLTSTAEELRGSITSLRSDLDELGGEVNDLGILNDTLRDRLDRLQRGD